MLHRLRGPCLGPDLGPLARTTNGKKAKTSPPTCPRARSRTPPTGPQEEEEGAIATPPFPTQRPLREWTRRADAPPDTSPSKSAPGHQQAKLSNNNQYNEKSLIRQSKINTKDYQY